MIVYKIKHKPTGLFYMPSRGNGNLGVKGKIYSTKPTLKHVNENTRIVISNFGKKLNKRALTLIDYFDIKRYEGFERKWHYYDKNHIIPKSDWEIIEL